MNVLCILGGKRDLKAFTISFSSMPARRDNGADFLERR